jgi:hypothetical protein
LQAVRPLNLGETLDASIKIVRARWKTLATVMVVIALPVQIANVAIISATTDVYQAGTGFSSDSSTKTAYSDDGLYFAGQVAILALSFLSYLLGTVACYRAVSDTYLGRPTSARASLGYAAERLGATLWLTIVLLVGLTAAFVALVLPGIWLAVAWSVAYPVMLVEGGRGVGALRRSFQLTQSRWWATFGRIAVAYILVLVLSAVAAVVFVLPAEAFTDDTSFGALVLEHVGDFIVSLITTPFLAAVATLVYFDLRVRKEGFDPAHLAEPTGGAPAAAGGPPSTPPPSPARGSGGLWAPPAEPEHDAFGHPVAPSGGAPEAPSAPGSWAPPVAPEPRRPPDRDD